MNVKKLSIALGLGLVIISLMQSIKIPQTKVECPRSTAVVSTIVSNDQLVVISPLKFEFEGTNKAEVIGSVTNRNTTVCDVSYNIEYLNSDKSVFYTQTISFKNMQSNETRSFNCEVKGVNLINRQFIVKLVPPLVASQI